MNIKKISLYLLAWMGAFVLTFASVVAINRADDGKQKNSYASNAVNSDVNQLDSKKENKQEKNNNKINDQNSEGKDGEQQENETNEAGINLKKPMVALTFDDGPSHDNTNMILDVLEKYHARATFFVVGYLLDGEEDTVLRAYNQGCEIASHTYDHIELTNLTRAQVRSQIRKTEKEIQAITGQEQVLLRPPYGSLNDDAMKEINSPIILWSIDTEDWKTRDEKSSIDLVLENVKDGDVILMHDSYKESATAAIDIIRALDSAGYQMVTVSELGEYRLGGLKTGVKYGAMRKK